MLADDEHESLKLLPPRCFVHDAERDAVGHLESLGAGCVPYE